MRFVGSRSLCLSLCVSPYSLLASLTHPHCLYLSLSVSYSLAFTRTLSPFALLSVFVLLSLYVSCLTLSLSFCQSRSLSYALSILCLSVCLLLSYSLAPTRSLTHSLCLSYSLALNSFSPLSHIVCMCLYYMSRSVFPSYSNTLFVSKVLRHQELL